MDHFSKNIMNELQGIQHQKLRSSKVSSKRDLLVKELNHTLICYNKNLAKTIEFI